MSEPPTPFHPPDPAQPSAPPRGPLAGWLPVLLAPWPALALLPAAVVGRQLLLALGRRDRAERFSARVQRRWAAATARLFGVRRRPGPVPRGAGLVAANHLSWLDVLVLGATLDCRFVAKSEIADWPLVGWLARSVGTIFVDRRSRRDAARVAGEMSRLLAAGVSVVLFPEGEVTDGRAVARFQPALFEPAARAELACHPVALCYRTPRAPEAARWAVGWWGGVGLVWHAARLGRFGPVEVECRFGAVELVDRDRKRLAERARAAVAAAYEPPPGASAPTGDPRAAADPV